MLEINRNADYEGFTLNEVVQRATYMKELGMKESLINLAIKRAEKKNPETKQISFIGGGK